MTLPRFLCSAPLAVTVRKLTAWDMPGVMAIEQAGNPHPWREDELALVLARCNGHGWVAEHERRTLGFLVYELHGDRVQVLALSVHTAFRRREIGRHLLTVAAEQMVRQRNRVQVVVRESNTAAHLFLRACGFRATLVDRGAFGDTKEDGYVFEYRGESGT